MARKRMIDPGIWDSEDFSKLSILARLVFIGLFSQADDEGRGTANVKYLKSKLFPYDDDVSSVQIGKALKEIGAHMSIAFYAHEGKDYYVLESWESFQTINKPTASKIPLPEDYRNATVVLPPNRIEEKRKEKEEKEIEVSTCAFGEFHNVCFKDGEYEKLVERYGKPLVEDKIAYLDSQIQSKVKKYIDYKDHYATIGNWCRADKGARASPDRDPESGIPFAN